MASLDTASQRAQVETWIQQFCNRYPGIAYVDVVNEPIHAPPVYKDALGGDGKTGWDWVIKSFELARKYCAPGAKLHLNEYNILHSNTATNNYLQLIQLLKERGLIDGIGIQGHYFEFRSDMRATTNVYVHNINTIKSNLDKLATAGLPIYVTEFDIDEDVDANQLAQYKIYFPIFWYHPAVKGITFWGYIQGDVWTSHPYTYLLLSNGTERPALQWLRTFIKCPIAPDPISPNNAGGIPRNPVLLWHAAATATSCHVQVGTNSTFTATIKDTTVTDTLLFLNPLDANRRYFWRVSGINEYGESDFSAAASFQTGDQISAVEDIKTMPSGYHLFQNYPNPFNPTTTITFNLPRRSEVRLILVNMLGEKIMDLAAGNFEAGTHAIPLNAANLSSGVYFYRFEVHGLTTSKKLILMR
ncbi:endo-1,4-beta-xylanase [candidate division KSB1 bacterium]|nr:endo-1,4-beta-xylanase [candidate division KSB1 bacterium]